MSADVKVIPLVTEETTAYLEGLADSLGQNELPSQGIDFYTVVDVIEMFFLRYAQEKFGGNITHSANFLSLNRTTYLAKIKRLGIHK